MLMSRSSDARWKLGLHMFGTASDLAYEASTITLIRLLIGAPKDSKFVMSSLFQRAELRFKKILREGRNPDALTLQGMMLARDGGKHNEAEALAYFDRAIAAAALDTTGKFAPLPLRPSRSGAAGTDTHFRQQIENKSWWLPAAVQHNEARMKAADDVAHEKKKADGRLLHETDQTQQPRGRPFRWNWEATCHLGRGRLLLGKGDRAGAEAAFRVVAFELDNATGYLELGRMMTRAHERQPGPGPVPAGKEAEEEELAEEYLIKAAVSGEKLACELLGEMRLRRVAKSAGRTADASEHRLWATEWFQLAGLGPKAAALRASGGS
jgi:hypothetical protein